ncbi:MAG: hypothetical protein HY657_18615 [Acidobacteria bacterium]|nr:hypothetical protein [Acidobacteriota bacterium]
MTAAPDGVSVDAVNAELRGRVRERLRRRLLDSGGPRAFEDPALFADVEALLRVAADASETTTLMLPELLGDPAAWRLTTAMRYPSHRGPRAASIVIFFKRRILMPLFRWLFEYSRDNFERQRRLNYVLFACVQELAVETVRLRREVHRLAQDPDRQRRPHDA